MSEDPFAGGGESISWKDAPHGTTYVLSVTAEPEVVEGEDYNGNPQQKIIVHGTVNGEERALWMPKRGTLSYAIREAQRDAGELVGPGGTLTVTTDGLQKSPNDPKKEFRAFRASYVPAPKGDAFNGDDEKPPF